MRRWASFNPPHTVGASWCFSLTHHPYSSQAFATGAHALAKVTEGARRLFPDIRSWDIDDPAIILPLHSGLILAALAAAPASLSSGYYMERSSALVVLALANIGALRAIFLSAGL